MKPKTSYRAFAACVAGVAGVAGLSASPEIAEQPADQMAYVGGSATFTVAATGASALTYQWHFNGTALADQTTESLDFAEITFSQAGTYSVVVSNGDDSVTSQAAWLSVLPTNVVNLGARELRFGELSAPLWEAARADDAAPCITGDGLTLLYGSKAPGGSGDLDLWMVTRSSRASAWGAPVNLGPTVNSPAADTAPRLSPDGLSLYFASTRSGGEGGHDLWVASRSSPSDPFGTPGNLGPAVNSASDDAIVDVSADSLTLVFDSLRPGGLGQDDVWLSTRASADAPWGPAVNFDAPINSSSGDFPVALSRDGTLLFFKSWRPNPHGPTIAAIYVCQRARPEEPFGPPILIQPILGIGTGGADFSTLSDDGTTLYVGTYRTQYPDWPQLVQSSITPLPQLAAPRMTALGEFRFDLLGRAGATYEVEVSTDCRTWTPWRTVQTSDRVELSEPAPTPEGRRIYRVMSH